MMKQMFAGARIAIAVEPNGRVVQSSSPFIEGGKVTLLDLDFDQLLKDEALFTRWRTFARSRRGKAAWRTSWA